jgi:hypothetical protein
MKSYPVVTEARTGGLEAGIRALEAFHEATMAPWEVSITPKQASLAKDDLFGYIMIYHTSKFELPRLWG